MPTILLSFSLRSPLEHGRDTKWIKVISIVSDLESFNGNGPGIIASLTFSGSGEALGLYGVEMSTKEPRDTVEELGGI